jgi:hypothetical protein
MHVGMDTRGVQSQAGLLTCAALRTARQASRRTQAGLPAPTPATTHLARVLRQLRQALRQPRQRGRTLPRARHAVQPWRQLGAHEGAQLAGDAVARRLQRHQAARQRAVVVRNHQRRLVLGAALAAAVLQRRGVAGASPETGAVVALAGGAAAAPTGPAAVADHRQRRERPQLVGPRCALGALAGRRQRQRRRRRAGRLHDEVVGRQRVQAAAQRAHQHRRAAGKAALDLGADAGAPALGAVLQGRAHAAGPRHQQVVGGCAARRRFIERGQRCACQFASN